MKQNIYFYWLEGGILNYSNINDVIKFCKKYKFIPRWQDSCWSIGIFDENNNDKEIERIINFGLQYFVNPPTKITKSSNKVRAKSVLNKLRINRLEEFNSKLKKSHKKRGSSNITVNINDIFNISDVLRVEKMYRYKFSNSELEKHEIYIKNKLNKYNYLEDALLKK